MQQVTVARYTPGGVCLLPRLCRVTTLRPDAGRVWTHLQITVPRSMGSLRSARLAVLACLSLRLSSGTILRPHSSFFQMRKMASSGIRYEYVDGQTRSGLHKRAGRSALTLTLAPQPILTLSLALTLTLSPTLSLILILTGWVAGRHFAAARRLGALALPSAICGAARL